MYIKSIKAMVSAVRSLLARPRVLVLLVTAYVGLLAAVYVFVSTREATISQLVLTLFVVVAAPALFFVVQAVSVSYAGGSMLARRITVDCAKLMVVSVPLIAVTLLALYGLSKVQTHLTIVTAVRYLLIAVIAPLLAIQLWIAATRSSLRSLLKNLRSVLARTLAPQSVFVYACGFLIFAVLPYFLLQKAMPIQRAWLEVVVLVVRLAAAAALMLIGWVTTVGAISIMNHTRRN